MAAADIPAGIVDEDVGIAEARHDLGMGAGDGGRIGDVGRNDERLRVRAAERGRSSSGALRRPVSATRAPLAAKAMAVARPIPEPAPVIHAIFPCSTSPLPVPAHRF